MLYPGQQESEQLLLNSPQFIQLQAKTQASKYLWQHEKAEQLPSLSLSAYHSDTRYSGSHSSSLEDNHGLGGSITLQWPITTGGYRSATIQSAEASYHLKQQEEAYQSYSLKQLIGQQHAAIHNHRMRIDAYSQAQIATQKAVSLAQQRYATGSIDLTTLLDTIQQDDLAQLETINAQLNYFDAILNLKALLNLLSEEDLNHYAFAS